MEDRSFATLVETHHAEICRYLQRAVSPRAGVDDLVEETFLRAFRVCRSGPAEADVRARLFAIATELGRSELRSKRRQRAAMPAGKEVSPVPEADRRGPRTVRTGGRAGLEALIERLPVTQRLALTMRKLHDLDYEAIGASLGCSPERARAHVFRALRTIRRGLDGLAPPGAEEGHAGEAADGSPRRRRTVQPERTVDHPSAVEGIAVRPGRPSAASGAIPRTSLDTSRGAIGPSRARPPAGSPAWL